MIESCIIQGSQFMEKEKIYKQETSVNHGKEEGFLSSELT